MDGLVALNLTFFALVAVLSFVVVYLLIAAFVAWLTVYLYRKAKK